MDFGQVPNSAPPGYLDSFDFSLPENDPKNALRGARKPAPRVYIGAPVWSHPGWVGSLYPRKTPSKEFLRFYSRQFNSIELNSTFYRIPDDKTLTHWREMTPPDFRFSPKLNQGISHGVRGAQLLGEFTSRIVALGDRLGMSFLQLPPSFSRNQLPTLRALLAQLPKNFSLAVEFRHPSWFIGQRLSPDAFDLLQELNLSTVITDTTSRRDVLHCSLTSNKVMIRFLGNELHPSDFARMDQWTQRIADWIQNGADEIYFFAHQAGYDPVPEMTRYLIKNLNLRAGLTLRNLELPEDSQPSLL
jgi:uncharacterized protein YecE (DUF72 family)